MPHNLLPAGKYVFSERPMLIYAELTRSCDLACRHCRAEALLKRDPNELTTEEVYTMLGQIKDFGTPYPHVVLTGGDPLNRPDVFDILAKGKELGIGMSLSPSATTHLTPDVFRKMKALDVQTISLSIDGASAAKHDAFRGVEGCFDMTVNAAETANEFGMPFQVNTLVSENTVQDLPLIYELVKKLGTVRWSVFFLISVGRGTALRELSPDGAEEVMNWLARVSLTSSFPIKTTEAPHYRRVQLERHRAGNGAVTHKPAPMVTRGFGIRDANGIMFISHHGDVYPSGFMPLTAGNVRQNSIADIYRHSEVFTTVRDPHHFSGKCGICEYRYICGGSRARAYAATGNPLASDPLCAYQPQRKKTIRKEAAASI